MTAFRRPKSAAEFVGGAAVAQTLEEAPPPVAEKVRAVAPPAPVAPPPRPLPPPLDLIAGASLHPRVMKQVNFDMPETDHFELKRLVDSIPRMTMRTFILEAIRHEITRVRAEGVVQS